MAHVVQRYINGKWETIVSVDLMRRSDAYTIAHFAPSEQLMYRAAKGVYDAVKWRAPIAIVAGSGNNGGDGLALACILADNGISSKVFRTSEKLTDSGRLYLAQALEKGVDIVPFAKDTSLHGYAIIVDCILGTGFSGVVRDMERAAIQALNASGAYVVSVDINSGINGDTGQGEIAVRSDLTVSIGYYKQGLFVGDAPMLIGSMINVDIGIILV